ncbi:hypothetical protein IU421_29960 [Nocardia cyriacigeorgica]|uniref:hypothetical protein n=1 Tax=Nocardia cyriacigeorgica TaxID=135487 RepID=UPI001894CA3F|nr:hypothetical protein [Nocardia cyriacigeorgica]MBF6518471.1 hypothetical protein [Nocardia cyriacigeorgica]
MSTRFSAWRARYAEARAERELLAYREATLGPRAERYPVLAWEQLLKRRRWSLRALIGVAVVGMLAAAFGIASAAPGPGVSPGYFAAAGATALGGSGVLAVCMHNVDALGPKGVGSRGLAAVEAAVLGAVLAGVLATGVHGHASSAQVLVTVSFVAISAAAAAAVSPVSGIYRAAMQKAMEANGVH